MYTTLLTAAGSASALPVMQALRKAGHRIVACDIYPREWNAASCEADVFFQALTVADEAAYVAQLTDAVLREGVNYLIPLTDIEVDVLCRCKEPFAAMGCTLCVPDAPVAALCRDKLRMAQLLEASSICRTIPTYPARSWQPDEYPVMLKPVSGRSSQAQVVARNAQEYASAIARRDDYIAQPFIEGPVFTVDVARDAHGHVVCLARQELLRTVNGLGTTVRVEPGHALEAVCAAIARKANIVGVVNMEFIQNGDDFYFLEVNPRFSGGVGFSILAGADFASMEIACHTGGAIAPAPALAPLTITRRTELCVTGR